MSLGPSPSAGFGVILVGLVVAQTTGSLGPQVQGDLFVGGTTFAAAVCAGQIVRTHRRRRTP